MIYCAEYCLDMPDSFPVVEFTEFMNQARVSLRAHTGGSAAWNEFAGASNLIGWRFRASYEAWQEHRASVAAFGGGRHHEDIYAQERALFLMFAAGVSCIDSVVYAVAAACSHDAVLGIPFDAGKRRMCNARTLKSWLEGSNKAEELTSALSDLLGSTEWALWVDLRNRMTHRGNLPRRLFATVGAPAPPKKPLNFAPTTSTPDIDLDLSDFDALHEWLADELRKLILGGLTVLK